MKLVVGLGNPGSEYQGNRHNVGFEVAEALATKLAAGGFERQKKLEGLIAKADGVMLLKPQTFMNRSGEAVVKALQYFGDKAAKDYGQLFVAHDDLDIRLGEYKIGFGTGPKVHNGINSVRQALKTDQFWYVRIGTDNRTSEERAQMPGQAYVLGQFTSKEREIVENVINQVTAELMAKLA